MRDWRRHAAGLLVLIAMCFAGAVPAVVSVLLAVAVVLIAAPSRAVTAAVLKLIASALKPTDRETL